MSGDAVKLSICIATLNRAGFIGETLDSIAAQWRPGVEVVVVDGASSDDTGAVVQARAPRLDLRYFREAANSGVDRDYDKAVGYARGDYCWLMTDDDLIEPGALDAVLAAIADAPPVIVVNTCVRDLAMRETLVARHMAIARDETFDPAADARLAAECIRQLSFIGSAIVARGFWRSRDSAAYYGSLFVHVGVIFQAPLRAIRLLAAPAVAIRYGNAMWTPRSFEIWMFKWPGLVWSFDWLPQATRAATVRREPWRNGLLLAVNRGAGAYSRVEYTRYLAPVARGRARLQAWCIAHLPARLVNLAAVIAMGLFRRDNRVRIHDLLASRHAGAASRGAARLLRLSA